jgi:hypothetical protein
MTSEANVKRNIVKSMQEGGGYARRFEDQYAVGTYDMLLIPRGLPVFTAEIKMVRGTHFGPTPRQMIELQRITDAANNGGHVIPVVIGWKDGVYYFHKPKMVIPCVDCFSVTTSDVPFYKQLVLYYYSQKSMELLNEKS